MALDEMGISQIPGDGVRPANVRISKHVVATSLLLGRRFVNRRVTRDNEGRGVARITAREPARAGSPFSEFLPVPVTDLGCLGEVSFMSGRNWCRPPEIASWVVKMGFFQG